MSEPTILSVETQYLPVKLTQQELTDKVDQFTQTLRLAAELKVRHEGEKAQMKAETTAMDARISRESGIIEARHEDRRVEVHWILDPEKPIVRAVRQDTGEILKERAATTVELQRLIPGDVVEEAPQVGDGDEDGA